MPPRTDEDEPHNSMMVANQSEITNAESCPESPSSVVVTPPHGSRKVAPTTTTGTSLTIDLISRSEPLKPRSSSSSAILTTMTNDNLTIQVSQVLPLTTTTHHTTCENQSHGHDHDDESPKVMVHIDKVSHTVQHMGLAHGHASIRLQLLRGGPSSPPQVRFSPTENSTAAQRHPRDLPKEIQVLEAQCIQLNSALPIHTTNVDTYTSFEYGTNITTLMLHFPTFETTSPSSAPPLVQIELVLA